MANSTENSPDFDYADKLWQAADKLRGTVDASEYKHVVLGLLFLKYFLGKFAQAEGKLGSEFSRRARSSACSSRCSNPTGAASRFPWALWGEG